ncbi:YgiT-type zinc finger protein [Candidatus Micrarchaeota archaeon]|nr:YgiT-type zinc finger protein [Candidatus Micrarchaeota archaeon]
MREVNIPAYEHEKGVVLRDVSAVECPKCGEWAFTKQQIDEVERRNDVANARRFAFNRTI